MTRGKLLVSNHRGLEVVVPPQGMNGCTAIDFYVNRFVL
jgi:hypothetical protein